MSENNLSSKQTAVFDLVKTLYENSEREEAHWMWKNHVLVVAQNTLDLAKRFGGNPDFVFTGALLHDLADVWYEREHPGFESKSRLEAEKILIEAGFNTTENVTILAEIIEPHSCYPDNYPKIIEGKILATADALAHLKTDFYYQFKIMGKPKTVLSDKFNEWVQSKIDRDFNHKIFFEEIKREVTSYYEKLKKDFTTTS